MRKTYDLKQVKISTSILWLLNKAQARKVFFSSTDIFSDKSTLHLHSLIIRGLISGELYSAALSKLFPSAHKMVRTKDFPAIIDFLFELDRVHLEEVAILRQKDINSQVECLKRQNPFEISEHLQIIDAIMAVNMAQSDLVHTIPTILGKLCNFRPRETEPKKLLELWFKSISCLSMSQRNIKNMDELIKIIITESRFENSADGQYLDNIKFSDKLALILAHDCEFIGVDANFLFEYTADGAADRNNVKHNFMTVLNIFRKKFPKVLEDFKEMMLVLNSSHVQISSNMLINIDTFMMEFFTSIDEFSNHGNRTFRTGSNIPEKNDMMDNMIGKIDKSGSSTDKMGAYFSQTINKPPSYVKDQFNMPSSFGTYSGRRTVPIDLEDPVMQENSMKWESTTPGTNLLNGSRKKSLPVTLDGLNSKRMVNSEVLQTDGSLKSMFIDRRNNREELDVNKTSWLEQLEISQKVNKESVSNDQENMGPRVKANETRLLLNMKRQEIERNRQKKQQQSAREMQLISDQAFKDVALRSARSDQEEVGNYRPKRVSDMKRSNGHTVKRDLVRSQSQDLSKPTVDDISASLNQLKSEISKLTSEQAKLTAKLESKRSDNSEIISPRTEPGSTSRNNDLESRISHRSSTRSQPPTWNARSLYNNEEPIYDNYRHQDPYAYQYESIHQPFYPFPSQNVQFYHPRYPQEFQGHQCMPQHYPRSMAKSVQESNNSRVTSPVAISEPAKAFGEVIMSPKKDQNAEMTLLTVNNLIKHNESMEIIVQPNMNQEWIKTISKEDVNSIPTELKCDETSVEELPKEIRKEEKDEKESSDEVLQTFYVSFNDQPHNGERRSPPKPLKPPRPPIAKRSNKQENMGPSTDVPTINNSSVTKPVIKEKPVAFVISVDDEETFTKPSDNETIIKEKLAQIEKREQERKEKLEKTREMSRVVSDKRLEKEIEKEKIKQEKELKRKAIFEAYLEKKVENEGTEKPNRRETRLPKRLNRAVSAAPLQRNEPISNNDILSPTDMQSFNSKADKLSSVTPSSTKLFVAPKAKSNKGVILNAIKYCCLAGKVNEGTKQQTIEDLEKCEVPHMMVLMRGGCQYRSLYGFNPETEILIKISGMGPKKITSKMVERFYKYNSGSKKFIEIDSTSHLSTVIDGITIYNSLWKSTIPGCGQFMSSETSSVTEQISQ